MLNLMFLLRFEIPNDQGWQPVTKQAQKMKAIPSISRLEDFSSDDYFYDTQEESMQSSDNDEM